MKKYLDIIIVIIGILWGGNYILNSFDFYQKYQLEKQYSTADCEITYIREDNIKSTKYISFVKECPTESIYLTVSAEREFDGSYTYLPLNVNMGSNIDSRSDGRSILVDPDNKLILVFGKIEEVDKILITYYDDRDKYNLSNPHSADDPEKKEIVFDIDYTDENLYTNDKHYFEIFTYEDLNIKSADSHKLIIYQSFFIIEDNE